MLSISMVIAKNDSIPLIKPTGSYPIGTMTYYLTDSSRNYSYSSYNGDFRTIPVQIWYPAEKDEKTQRAPYGGMYPDYSMIQTHSQLRPEFNRQIEKSPVIIFCPGRGFERFVYNGLIEELVSHGYVVVSIDMPEIGFTSYPDGQTIKASARFEPPEGLMSGPYEEVDKFFEAPVKLGLEDLNFAFSHLENLNSNDPTGRFKGKLDLGNSGIFGHSLGGRIAGAFAEIKSEIRAYTSMEGIPPRDIRYQGKLKIPSLMLCSQETWYYAEENYLSMIDNRTSQVDMVKLIDFGHNSLTDGPFLFSKSFRYSIDAVRAIEIGRKLLLDFYNQELMQKGNFGNGFDSIIQIKHDHYPKPN